jgi:sigma-B regulation protein RsbU (phosphoserine phosphatase)
VNKDSPGHNYAGLLRMAGEMSRETDLTGLLLKILQRSHPWMRAEACSIFLPDPETGELVIHSAHGDSAPTLGGFRIPPGQGIVGAAMEERRTLRVDDAASDSRFYRKGDETTGWTTRTLLASPLLDGGECLGVIEFINAVGRPAFTAEDEQMVEYFAGLVAAALGRIRAQAAALERAQMQRDLELARELQAGLLPRVFPSAAELPGLELFARLEPAREVSGDLYDFFELSPGRLCFVVGDVSGKGIAAGLFMAMTRTLLRATAAPGLDPQEILMRVNHQLVRDNQADLFVTLMLGIVESGTGRVTYGLCGHPPPLLIAPSGSPQFQATGGTPLGILPEARVAQRELVLQPGETLLVYTDGVTEAMDMNQTLFGEERLRAAGTAVAGDSAQSCIERVLAQVAGFVGDAEVSDDIALLAIRRRE